MKKKNKIYFFLLFLIGVIFFESCNFRKPPDVKIFKIKDLSLTTVTCLGTILKYKKRLKETEIGVCWSTGNNPSINDNKTTDSTDTFGIFTSYLTGLNPNTKYFVRAYSNNSAGTVYGDVHSFTTINEGVGKVTDIDGNIYHTVTIGKQVWMVENLNVTKYRNGDPIYKETDNFKWSSLKTEAYRVYSYSPDNDVYGKLYNWYAINDTRGLAPKGWHIPSKEEFLILMKVGSNNLRSRLINNSNTNISKGWTGSDSSGFSALPGGWDNWGGWTVDEIGSGGHWWSSTEQSSDYAYSFGLPYCRLDRSESYGFPYKHFGCSVRCIKD